MKLYEVIIHESRSRVAQKKIVEDSLRLLSI